MVANKLKLNLNNSEVLLVGRRFDLRYKVSLILDGITLPLKVQVCNLGVLLD